VNSPGLLCHQTGTDLVATFEVLAQKRELKSNINEVLSENMVTHGNPNFSGLSWIITIFSANKIYKYITVLGYVGPKKANDHCD